MITTVDVVLGVSVPKQVGEAAERPTPDGERGIVRNSCLVFIEAISLHL